MRKSVVFFHSTRAPCCSHIPDCLNNMNELPIRQMTLEFADESQRSKSIELQELKFCSGEANLNQDEFKHNHNPSP